MDKKLKDFLYMDTDKLYSFFSQVFEGLIYNEVSADSFEESKGDAQKGPLLQGSSLESKLVLTSQKYQSKFLHDHVQHVGK